MGVFVCFVGAFILKCKLPDNLIIIMRIVSYNINGIRSALNKGFLDWLKTNPADIICLQEVDHNVRRSHYHDQPKMLADHFKAVGHLQQTNVKLKSGGYGNLPPSTGGGCVGAREISAGKAASRVFTRSPRPLRRGSLTTQLSCLGSITRRTHSYRRHRRDSGESRLPGSRRLRLSDVRPATAPPDRSSALMRHACKRCSPALD